MPELPKTLGQCADLLYQTREKRYALQRRILELEEVERALKTQIIDTLPKSDASGVAGRVARVSVVEKVRPQAEDWSLIHQYVKRKGAFELLQRRLNTAAVEERLEAGEQIPGIVLFHDKTVSINKV
jgi:hypothetical protein